MTVDRRVSSIEASFNMEDVQFDNECCNRVKSILEEKISVSDAISHLNKKYGVSSNENERSRI